MPASASNTLTAPDEENSDKTSSVYIAIRDDVYARRWPFDTQLNLQEIADELRVSRTPVREALIRLSVEHLVQLRPGKGFFVRERHWQDDLYDLEVLFALLKAMAEKSIHCFTGEGIIHLLQRGGGGEPTDITIHVMVIENIYDRIISPAGNPTATRLARALAARTTFARSKFLEQAGRRAAAIAIVKELVIGLETQNLATASKCLQDLYSEKASFLLSQR